MAFIMQIILQVTYASWYVMHHIILITVCVYLFFTLEFLIPLERETVCLSLSYMLTHCHISWGIKYTFNLVNKSLRNT